MPAVYTPPRQCTSPGPTNRPGHRVPVAGAPAERPAPVSSQASARGGLAGRAAEKWELGWAVACALGHLAVGSSRACGVAPAAPPPVAEGTAGPVAETRQRGLRRAVCPGAAGAACAGWQRSAPGAPWTDHTAAGFASVPPAGRPAGQGASLLQDRNPGCLQSRKLSPRTRAPTWHSHRTAIQSCYSTNGRFNWQRMHVILALTLQMSTEKAKKGLGLCMLAPSRKAIK